MIDITQYLTVKQYAERVGISEQAVYKKLNTSLKGLTTEIKGKKYINIKALEDSKQNDNSTDNNNILNDFKQEYLKQLNEVEKLQTENKHLQEIQQLNNSLIESLKQQLNEKDSQISYLHTIIDQSQKLQLISEQKKKHKFLSLFGKK